VKDQVKCVEVSQACLALMPICGVLMIPATNVILLKVVLTVLVFANVRSLMVVEVMDKCVSSESTDVLRARDVSMIQMITVIPLLVELVVLGIANAMSPARLWTVSGLSSVNGAAIQPGMRMGVN
jgi:hypothetical protein